MGFYGLCAVGPFDECELRFSVLSEVNFNAGNAAGMNTGPRVVVGGIGGLLFDVRGRHTGIQEFLFRERQVSVYRAMGVSGNEGIDPVCVIGGPLMETFVGVVCASRVIGGPSGIFDAQALHAGPDTAHKKFRHGCPKPDAFGVGLVTVPHQNMFVQQNRFIETDAGEKIRKWLRIATPFEIVVSPNFDVSGFVRMRVMKSG